MGTSESKNRCTWNFWGFKILKSMYINFLGLQNPTIDAHDIFRGAKSKSRCTYFFSGCRIKKSMHMIFLGLQHTKIDVHLLWNPKKSMSVLLKIKKIDVRNTVLYVENLCSWPPWISLGLREKCIMRSLATTLTFAWHPNFDLNVSD